MNFIQQAYKGRNEWFIYLMTLFVVGFGWQFLGVIPLLITAFGYAEDINEFHAAAQTNFTGLGINSNLYLFLIITMFAFGLLFLMLGVKFLHKRPFKTVITSRNSIDWKRFWFSFISWGLISFFVVTIGIVMEPEHYTWNFKPLSFLVLVLISFLFLPIQTSFEEFLFRGYLMQGLGILVKNRWFPLIITSVIFGLLHGANPEVAKLGPITMVFYIGTGLLFGVVTLLDEGMELALGLHAINNIVAAFYVTTDWTVFQTEALFIDSSEPSVGLEMFLPVLVLYPILLFFFSKKYEWKNWKEKLFGKIDFPRQEDMSQMVNK